MYEKSLSICREIGDRDGEAMALNNLGEMAVAQRDFTLAIELSQKSLKIAQEIEEDWTIVVCYNNLGEAFCGVGSMTGQWGILAKRSTWHGRLKRWIRLPVSRLMPDAVTSFRAAAGMP